VGTSPFGRAEVVVDRFTVIDLAHVALREVTGRFMNELSVTQKRRPQLRRARFLLASECAALRCGHGGQRPVV